MSADRVQRIKDRLTRIADEDTRRVVEINAALSRMAELGLTNEQVHGLLSKEPEPVVVPPWLPPGADLPVQTFHGFRNRRQAAIAYFASLPKPERPFEDVSKRVEALIKNQAPERQADALGLVMISIPAPQPPPVQAVPGAPPRAELPPAPAAVRFKRMSNGKLRQLPPPGTADPIDVDEVTESTVTVKKVSR